MDLIATPKNNAGLSSTSRNQRDWPNEFHSMTRFGRSTCRVRKFNGALRQLQISTIPSISHANNSSTSLVLRSATCILTPYSYAGLPLLVNNLETRRMWIVSAV